MKNTSLWVLTIGLLALMPFVTGCFTKGGLNPMADTSLAQAPMNTIATADVSAINANKVKPNTNPSRKYTFSAPPHAVTHRLREGLSHVRGCLKIWLQSLTKADHIYITVEQIRVKPQNGKFVKLAIAAREIDLLQAADVSQIVGEMDLPSGMYNHLEFLISNPRLIVNGQQEKMFMLGNRVRFVGKFEVKDGFRTDLSMRFLHKVIKTRGWWKKDLYWFVPVVKVSSTLVPIAPPPSVVDGDLNLLVSDFVKKTPLSGVNATLEGTSFSGMTDSNGVLTLSKVPAGSYNLKLARPDYLDKVFPVAVAAGQVADAAAEMNPAVILSALVSTGWFSEEYPLADASGLYGEVAMETPVAIDFVSLNFLKAEVSFDAEFQQTNSGLLNAYLSSTQQVQTITNMGNWWVGNNAVLGSLLGEFRATNPATHHTVDVTEFVRSNPNSTYFLAALNKALVNIRMNNIQLKISYR